MPQNRSIMLCMIKLISKSDYLGLLIVLADWILQCGSRHYHDQQPLNTPIFPDSGFDGVSYLLAETSS